MFLSLSLAIFVICSILLSSLLKWLFMILLRFFSICVWESLAVFCAFCLCFLDSFWAYAYDAALLCAFDSLYRQRCAFHCHLRSKVHFDCRLWCGVHRILDIFSRCRTLLLCDHVLVIWSIALFLVAVLTFHISIFVGTIQPHSWWLFCLVFISS